MPVKLTQQLQTIHALFPCQNCVVIGSGKGDYVEVLQDLKIENAILVEADKRQIEKMQKLHDLPATYTVENLLIYKDEEQLSFNIATNPTVNCFKSVETYKKVMPNTALVETKQMESLSLDSLLLKHSAKKTNWLFIDTFTALEILDVSQKSLEKLDVIVCRLLLGTDFEVEALLLKNGFKLLQKIEENNPQVVVSIFAKDYEQSSAVFKDKNVALQNRLTETQVMLEISQDEVSVKEVLVTDLGKKLEALLHTFEEEKCVLESTNAALLTQHDNDQNSIEMI